MDAWLKMVPHRKTHSDKQTFSSHLLGYGEWPRTHHGEQTSAFFLNYISSWAWGAVSPSLGHALHKNPKSRKATFIYYWHVPLFQPFNMCAVPFLFVSFDVYFPLHFSLSFILVSSWNDSATQRTYLFFHCFQVWPFTIDVCFEYTLAVSVKADKHSAVATLHWGDSCLLYRMYFCQLFAL